MELLITLCSLGLQGPEQSSEFLILPWAQNEEPGAQSCVLLASATAAIDGSLKALGWEHKFSSTLCSI